MLAVILKEDLLWFVMRSHSNLPQVQRLVVEESTKPSRQEYFLSWVDVPDGTWGDREPLQKFPEEKKK